MTEQPGQTATGTETLQERAVGALMRRWGVDDGDQDAYDAACADFDSIASLVAQAVADALENTLGHPDTLAWDLLVRNGVRKSVEYIRRLDVGLIR